MFRSMPKGTTQIITSSTTRRKILLSCLEIAAREIEGLLSQDILISEVAVNDIAIYRKNQVKFCFGLIKWKVWEQIIHINFNGQEDLKCILYDQNLIHIIMKNLNYFKSRISNKESENSNPINIILVKQYEEFDM